ncbi:uncharacterized protein LOC141628766 [Silene latifolia]|uniref:uncharacterized protein LOC141628766 n=1 Tax=Silene latifolia TaxID=37657 RepID=UPI003D77A89C
MGIHMICKGHAISDLTIESELYDDIKRKQELDPKIQEWKTKVGDGEVAYRLGLPPSLDRVHNVLHVSQLRKYVSDPSHVLEVENIKLDEALTYAKVLKEILDRKVHKTRNGENVLLKVLWSNHNVEEATWEPKEAIRERYPHLFEQVYLVTGS